MMPQRGLSEHWTWLPREVVEPLLLGPARQWPKQRGLNSLSGPLERQVGLLRALPARKVLPTCSQRPETKTGTTRRQTAQPVVLLLMRNISLIVSKRLGEKFFFF